MSARVLVVDDIAANVRLLEAKLLVEYYEVLTVNDGATALEIVAEAMPDIMLLDVMMPELNGFQVCRRIKQHPDFTLVPVIMLTAKTSAADRFWGENAGADAYLTKPVDSIELVETLRSLLEDG